MKYKEDALKIIALKNDDLEMRERLLKTGGLRAGYNEEMEALHKRNAEILDEIIDRIAYPTIDRVGVEASEAAWLIIQHSIGLPEFMRKCLKLLESAEAENRANPKNLAYLSDRIAVFEGKPQLYGTQFDWDENEELNPNPYDDLGKVNKRRKSIGLNTLEEQIVKMRLQAEMEEEHPIRDYLSRKQEEDAWRKKVGWIE